LATSKQSMLPETPSVARTNGVGKGKRGGSVLLPMTGIKKSVDHPQHACRSKVAALTGSSCRSERRVAEAAQKPNARPHRFEEPHPKLLVAQVLLKDEGDLKAVVDEASLLFRGSEEPS